MAQVSVLQGLLGDPFAWDQLSLGPADFGAVKQRGGAIQAATISKVTSVTRCGCYTAGTKKKRHKIRTYPFFEIIRVEIVG